MKIAISGASGLIGTALKEALSKEGHQVISLVRRKELVNDNSAFWSFEEKALELEKLEGLDAFVHLAGKNIASSYWTESLKKELYDSRIEGTRFLVESLAKLKSPPKACIFASAIGFYEEAGSTEIDESSPAGEGFLAQLTRDWEQEALKAKDFGSRVVLGRIGVVLSKKGGALKVMLLPFKFRPCWDNR